jgi:hypothetical protein
MVDVQVVKVIDVRKLCTFNALNRQFLESCATKKAARGHEHIINRDHADQNA